MQCIELQMRLASICSKVILYGKSGSSQGIMFWRCIHSFWDVWDWDPHSPFDIDIDLDLVWFDSVLSSLTLTAWRGWCLQMRETCAVETLLRWAEMGSDGPSTSVGCWPSSLAHTTSNCHQWARILLSVHPLVQSMVRWKRRVDSAKEGKWRDTGSQLVGVSRSSPRSKHCALCASLQPVHSVHRPYKKLDSSIWERESD